MKDETLIFLQSKTKQNDIEDFDEIPMASSVYRNNKKEESGGSGSNSNSNNGLNILGKGFSNSGGARNTPIQSDWDQNSEVDTFTPKGKDLRNSDDYSVQSSTELKKGRRGRRDRVINILFF